MDAFITFVETAVFTERVVRLGLEEELRKLQLLLVENPTAGLTDSGTGGFKKIRMSDPARGKGKRGGVRIHYLWLAERETIYLIFVYGKNENDRLTSGQKKKLAVVVEQIKNAPRGRK